ncbi:biotin transporter BioY [Streptomyces tubercidicus]|uniref:biotin transporter BioY n=1 Tax=Streptomyces tubercidicus TaxID=47759 RepID=UPI0036B08D87
MRESSQDADFRGDTMRTKDLAHVALFAALTAALGLVPPLDVGFVPTPVTAQTLGVMLAGAVLGARRAGLALLVFVALVAVGLPVLAGGRGGLGALLGPSGGFVLSWPVGAFVTGLLTERVWHRYHVLLGSACNLVGGVLVVYLIGIPYMALIGHLTLRSAFVGSLAFVPGDLVKTVVAAMAAVAVRRAYPLIEGTAA